MKSFIQLLIFICVIFILNSCDKDEDVSSGNASNITVTVDGKKHVFNTIQVSVYENDLFVSREFWARIDNKPNRVISFSMTDYPDSLEHRFIYSQDGEHYTRGMQGTYLNSHFTKNSATQLVGTFSGKLYDLDRDSVSLENGTIHIIY